MTSGEGHYRPGRDYPQEWHDEVFGGSAVHDHSHDTSHTHPQFASLTWIKQDIRSHSGCLTGLASWCLILTTAVVYLLIR